MSVAATNYAIRFCGLQDVAAKMVLTALAWKSDQATPHLAHMSNEQLREETGLKSVNGIKEALRRLVAAGEVTVLRVGGRNLATEYELSGYLRHAQTAEVSPSDISDYDSKVSPNDTNRQITTVKCRHLTPKDKDNIGSKNYRHRCPCPAANRLATPQQDKQHRRAHGHKAHLHHGQRAGQRKWGDGHGRPADQQYVVDIGANHIANCKPWAPLYRGRQRSGEFWQAGANCHDGQPDGGFRHADKPRQINRTGNQRLSPSHQ
jgi:hypothetical protein